MDWGRNARGELEWRSFDPPEFDSRKLQELSRALQEASKKMSYSFEPPSIESSSADEKIFHIYSDTFENIEEVVEYIKNTKINGNIFDAHNPSSNDPKSSGFNDFFDFEEALNALEYGTSRYFNSFNYKLKKVNDCIKKYSITKKTSYKNDVVGFVPIVPNFIIGHPVNMINQEQKEKIKPTATIIFEKAMAAQYNSDDMISFASIIFSLIQTLEKKGIRCEVYISSVFRNNDEVYIYKLKIKNFMQPLNLYKLQFPVIATDMFRRIGFRLLECCQNLKNYSWKHSYGQVLIGREGYNLNDNGEPNLKLQNLLKIKQDDIFIPNFTYFNYDSSNNIDYTIKNIINQTNLKKYITLQEDK